MSIVIADGEYKEAVSEIVKASAMVGHVHLNNPTRSFSDEKISEGMIKMFLFLHLNLSLFICIEK